MATRRSGYYKSSYAADIALFDTPYRKLFLGLFLLIVMSLPLVAGQQLLHVVNLTIIAIIGALALNLLTGYAGQLSLGHAAFLGVGGYASQYISEFGLPFPVVVLLVTLFGAILGILVGAPALRLRGLYLVLATLGFHYIAIYVIHVYHASGEDSIMVLTGFLLPTADLGFVQLDSTVRWFYFFVFACVCVTAFCLNLVRTRVVRAWIALRERHLTAAALGINIGLYKLKAFVISSALTCMAGSFLVYYLGSVSAEYYTLDLAVSYLAMVVIGGYGSILGSFLGAIFIATMPFVITWLFELFEAGPRLQSQVLIPLQIIVFGSVMILFLIFEPRGLIGIWRRIRTYFELWPLSRSMLAAKRD